jgi:hypothetical protein
VFWALFVSAVALSNWFCLRAPLLVETASLGPWWLRVLVVVAPLIVFVALPVIIFGPIKQHAL